MDKKVEYSESGAPIYRYENVEEKWQAPQYGDEELCAKLDEHISKYIGESDMVWHEILSNLVHLDVYHIKPTSERNYHTFITNGMSYLPMSTPEGQEDWKYSELMVCLPPEWPVGDEAFKVDNNYWPIWVLKMLARFPHQYQTWLSYGHTIPNGDPALPYAQNTKLCCALLLPPIDIHRDFLELKVNESRKIKFFSIIPIYKEEMEYKLKYGINALTEKFDQYKINEVINLNRKNVCKKAFWPFGK